MKKILYIAIAILTASIFASCSQDLLEIPQKGVVPYDSFYDGSPENAAAASVSIMQSVGQMYTTGAGFGIAGVGWCISNSMFVLTNAPSDDIYYGSGDKGDHVYGLEINEYRPSFGSSSEVIGQQYYVCYQLIRNCNLLLENWEESSDPTIKQARAEARLFRALAHFHLATYWGDVILVETTLTGAERPEVTPQAEVFKWCIDELTACANDLPSKSNLNDKKLAVRATKEFALALKGKVQVFAKDWSGAKTSLEAVINSGKYALVPGEIMSELLHGQCDACEEKLLDLNYLDYPGVRLTGKNHGQNNQANMWRSGNGGFWGKCLPTHIIQSEGWGGCGNPSKSFVDAIMEHEPNSLRRKAWIRSYTELITDFEWNGYEGAMTADERMMSDKIGLQPGYHYFGSVGYFAMKWAPRRADLNANTDATTHENQCVMRYAEVLLLYAEACAQLGETGGKGLEALNQVATRAGAPTYSALNMANVKQEKRFEMFMERCRFADLVRWGDAATVLKDQGKEVPSFYDPFWNAEGKPSGQPHGIVVDYSDAYYNSDYGFKADKNERMPFPKNDVEQNENLNQNPGWN